MIPGMGASGTAALYAVAFSLLLAIIDVVSRTRHEVSREASREASLWAYAVPGLVPYVAVLAGGDVIATSLVPVVVPQYLETELLEPLADWILPLAYAFFGVFAFRAILSNLSSNAFGRELTVRTWIESARDSAVVAITAKQTRAANERHQKRAHGLRGLPEEDLNGHIEHLIGEGAVARLESRAKQAGTDPTLYKALELAAERPSEVDAILKNAN